MCIRLEQKSTHAVIYTYIAGGILLEQVITVSRMSQVIASDVYVTPLVLIVW